MSALHESTQDGNNSARTAPHLLQGKCDRANITHTHVYLSEKGKENKRMHVQSEFL